MNVDSYYFCNIISYYFNYLFFIYNGCYNNGAINCYFIRLAYIKMLELELLFYCLLSIYYYCFCLFIDNYGMLLLLLLL